MVCHKIKNTATPFGVMVKNAVGLAGYHYCKTIPAMILNGKKRSNRKQDGKVKSSPIL